MREEGIILFVQIAFRHSGMEQTGQNLPTWIIGADGIQTSPSYPNLTMEAMINYEPYNNRGLDSQIEYIANSPAPAGAPSRECPPYDSSEDGPHEINLVSPACSGVEQNSEPRSEFSGADVAEVWVDPPTERLIEDPRLTAALEAAHTWASKQLEQPGLGIWEREMLLKMERGTKMMKRAAHRTDRDRMEANKAWKKIFSLICVRGRMWTRGHTIRCDCCHLANPKRRREIWIPHDIHELVPPNKVLREGCPSCRRSITKMYDPWICADCVITFWKDGHRLSRGNSVPVENHQKQFEHRAS